jgi:hypothetical protein
MLAHQELPTRVWFVGAAVALPPRGGSATATPTTGTGRRYPFLRHVTPVLRASCLLAFLLAGCGRDRGPERAVVSGTVTYSSKPVADGWIRFVPVPSCPAPMASASIVDGKYQVDTRGGCPVGTFKVQLEGYRAVATPSAQGAATGKPRWAKEAFPQQYLPEKYNAKTQLEITIPPGSGPITKNFELTD